MKKYLFTFLLLAIPLAATQASDGFGTVKAFIIEQTSLADSFKSQAMILGIFAVAATVIVGIITIFQGVRWQYNNIVTAILAALAAGLTQSEQLPFFASDAQSLQRASDAITRGLTNFKLDWEDEELFQIDNKDSLLTLKRNLKREISKFRAHTDEIIEQQYKEKTYDIIEGEGYVDMYPHQLASSRPVSIPLITTAFARDGHLGYGSLPSAFSGPGALNNNRGARQIQYIVKYEGQEYPLTEELSRRITSDTESIFFPGIGKARKSMQAEHNAALSAEMTFKSLLVDSLRQFLARSSNNLVRDHLRRHAAIDTTLGAFIAEGITDMAKPVLRQASREERPNITMLVVFRVNKNIVLDFYQDLLLDEDEAHARILVGHLEALLSGTRLLTTVAHHVEG